MNHQSKKAGRVDDPATGLFRLVFGVTVALSTLCLLLNVVLALAVSNPSAQQLDVLSTLSTGWKMGFGAIVGLLGGKAAA
ncbi:hypothetical protein LRP67_05630 [Nocardioides sp. cx-169]|uniref:hypothetical protein n=1 Tax=Nocardioides sp. cx-169 TaxID=2899080 RepID=UPI001E30002B|nr:hypothetical protein [Nocardioides sp. cx-169]MCD4533556.1 hypothetical protein [Nocardioides sp. cx-169]